MTVNELIEKLKEFPRDLPVFTYTNEYGSIDIDRGDISLSSDSITLREAFPALAVVIWNELP